MGLFEMLFGRPNIEKLKEKGDLEGLVKALRHNRVVVRQRAASELSNISALVRNLRAAVSLESWIAAKGYAESLGTIRDFPPVEPLITALKDADTEVRRQAASALSYIRDSRAVGPLFAALKDDDKFVREYAVRGLVGVLRLEDQFVLVQDAAWGALVEPLIIMLKEPSECVSVAWALGKIRDPKGVDPLVVALSDQSYVLRKVAAEALGTIGERRAVEPLIAALNDEYRDVRDSAAEALGRIGGPEAERALAEYRAHQK